MFWLIVNSCCLMFLVRRSFLGTSCLTLLFLLLFLAQCYYLYCWSLLDIVTPLIVLCLLNIATPFITPCSLLNIVVTLIDPCLTLMLFLLFLVQHCCSLLAQCCYSSCLSLLAPHCCSS